MSIDALFAELNYSLMESEMKRITPEQLVEELNMIDIEARVDFQDTLDEGWTVMQVQVRRR